MLLPLLKLQLSLPLGGACCSSRESFFFPPPSPLPPLPGGFSQLTSWLFSALTTSSLSHSPQLFLCTFAARDAGLLGLREKTKGWDLRAWPWHHVSWVSA